MWGAASQEACSGSQSYWKAGRAGEQELSRLVPPQGWAHLQAARGVLPCDHHMHVLSGDGQRIAQWRQRVLRRAGSWGRGSAAGDGPLARSRCHVARSRGAPPQVELGVVLVGQLHRQPWAAQIQA